MPLNFTKAYTLENDRVRLSPLQQSDFDQLVNFAIEEPNLWEYSLVSANSPDRMQSYIKKALEGKIEKVAYPFIIFDKKIEKFAGSTRFYDFQENHLTTQLGYTWIGEKFQGTGLNKNCKFLMLQFAFEELQLERVEFRADNNNLKSIAAMKSIGCSVEGVLRQNCKAQVGRRDSIILSILKEEWRSHLKEKLASSL